MLTEKELTYIEEHAQEARQLLLTLARIPAPSHHEEKRHSFVSTGWKPTELKMW